MLQSRNFQFNEIYFITSFFDAVGVVSTKSLADPRATIFSYIVFLKFSILCAVLWPVLN